MSFLTLLNLKKILIKNKLKLNEKQLNLLKWIIISEQDSFNRRKNPLTRKRKNKKIKYTDSFRHEQELKIIDEDLKSLSLLRDQLNYI